MTKTQFRGIMSILFRVWDGTENSDVILEDVCNTITHDVFKFDSDERAAFLKACKKGRYETVSA